ncbi:hypothetical protein ABT369_43900 [Dactylosporangium sp. NPDC000244]|uniref:hypothetical protein n=1 Tax=Dactylosporangium sp. NPDC000244 TaxID=3154365 RepID=UPI0033241E6A
MRRRVVLSSAAVICLSAGVSAPAAAYAPSPTAAAGAGTTVCTPNPKDVNEVSGLVAIPDGGYYAIQDSQPEPARSKIFVLDGSCKVTKTIKYDPGRALDPEDAALDKNGTLYVADIGDNDESSGGSKTARPTVAIWTLTAGSTTPVINRLTYPDGKKHDAEALLLTGDNLPIIITKAAPNEIYVAESALVPNTKEGVKLRKAGDFKALVDTKTANPLGLLGWKLITGAAASPDGSKVVVRTLSDAYEFDVPGGDVIKALTTGKPRITPLPNEPQGEAITYTPDGKNYVTASDQDSSKKSALLKYTPTDISVAAGSGGNVPSPKAKEQSLLQSITLQDITYAVAAIGIVGLGLVIVGVVGIRRSRAARRAAGPGNGRGDGPDDDFAVPAAVGGGAPGVYGGGGGPGGGPGGPGGPGVYGGGGQGGPGGGRGGPGGGVYGGGGGGGGRDGGGNVYGGGGGGGQGGGGVYGGGGGSERPGNRQGGGVYGGGGGGGGGGGRDGGGNVYGGGGGGGQGGGGGAYGGGDQRGFAQGPPPRDGRGGYGPGDQGGYDRGYAPHR